MVGRLHMSDIEIHIKSGALSYEAAFSAEDRAAAEDAKKVVMFILENGAGATSGTKPAPRKARRATTSVTTSPFGAASASEEDS